MCIVCMQCVICTDATHTVVDDGVCVNRYTSHLCSCVCSLSFFLFVFLFYVFSFVYFLFYLFSLHLQCAHKCVRMSCVCLQKWQMRWWRLRKRYSCSWKNDREKWEKGGRETSGENRWDNEKIIVKVISIIICFKDR